MDISMTMMTTRTSSTPNTMYTEDNEDDGNLNVTGTLGMTWTPVVDPAVSLPDQNLGDDHDAMACMICWTKNASDNDSISQKTVANNNEDTNKISFKVLPCGHTGCHRCLKGWIEQCEMNGHDVATCPTCRQLIRQDVAQQILGGRSYQRIWQHPTVIDEDMFVPDEFTQDWLDADENDTHQCTNCGMYTIRDDDADNEDTAALAACGLCGHVYCWNCQRDYDDCDDHDDFYDGHDHYEFYDPKSQIAFPTSDLDKFPIATREDVQNPDTMDVFVAHRQTAIDAYQRDRYEQIEPANYVFITSVFDEWTESADYVFLTSLFDECTEPADYVVLTSLFSSIS
mmetsp:Transcript_26296/g.49071  ORF Transcript_26296/g.49071 Transcript_26296/m.49071 type:complete len:341 (-) Transcript_26296:56-1078(-)